jgi:hypothetical protein
MRRTRRTRRVGTGSEEEVMGDRRRGMRRRRGQKRRRRRRRRTMEDGGWRIEGGSEEEGDHLPLVPPSVLLRSSFSDPLFTYPPLPLLHSLRRGAFPSRSDASPHPCRAILAQAILASS